jgi:GT2 family glycosyltransferase/glycosyltransferase involved in cell wall biosynthesis
MPFPDTGTESAVVALARIAMQHGVAALAARDSNTALRWLERAHRLVPQDANTKLTLATAVLATDPDRAASLFADVAGKHDVRQAWLGLAAARMRQAGPEAAAKPLAILLSRHAFVSDTSALADQIAKSGWCALRPDGGLQVHAVMPFQVTLDGRPIRGRKLPADWVRGRTIEVRHGDAHLLGSPIRIGAIRRLAGCVEACDAGLRGWAWHPGDPGTAPELTLTYANGQQQTVIAHDESVPIPHSGPLARPRTFHLTRGDLLDAPGLIHVAGADGKDLLGSPLDPFTDGAAHVMAAARIAAAYPATSSAGTGEAVPGDQYITPVPALRANAPVPIRPVGANARRRQMTIVIPVHDGGPPVLACLDSVLGSQPDSARVLVVDDGSSDPAIVTALDSLSRQRRITLLRHPAAQGFPTSANAGIHAAKARDVVLLNSDTLVPPGWLERLRDAAYSADDIGTVTPLSNEASILSYPGPAGTNSKPDQKATNRLDRLAVRANGAAVVDIPVGVAFCLYLRRDCLDAAGVFRADAFAQGYGEENDLCLRARRLGWRNVALGGLFVAHLGSASFGGPTSRTSQIFRGATLDGPTLEGGVEHLRERNSRVLEQLHPGHQALIECFLKADPLAATRRRIDVQAWKERARRWRQAAILITHDDGGGVERRLILSAQAHADAGRRPILLRPAETANGEPAIAVRDWLADDLPNLIFAMPREHRAVLRLLRAAKADRIEAHYLAGHAPSIYGLIAEIGVPYEVHVHDYAWFCPRVALVAAHDRYCGEPDLQACEACVADHGHFLKETISVAALRLRSAGFLTGARRVIVPADDTGVRMRRHFPALLPLTVPHEDDIATIRSAVSHGNQSLTARDGRQVVCVVGAIGVHKGYDVVLACARDADRRDLDLEFVVVGHTIDDRRMMDTGRVFVTGQFRPDEAVSLIAAQRASLGFVPSICPETWCLGLGDLWRAGLHAAAFDIGAPAERIRRTRRGIVLPLGLSANAINNRLMAAIRAGGIGD